MVGIVYLGLMLASRTDSHFVVEIIPLIFAKKPKIVKIFGLINAIIVDAFAIFLGSQGWKVCTKMLAPGKTKPDDENPAGSCLYDHSGRYHPYGCILYNQCGF